MPSLIESNAYLRDPQKRRRMIEENVYDSSVFEGATGLPKPAIKKKAQVPPRRRRMADAKNAVRDS